jgi:hypothetical protein
MTCRHYRARKRAEYSVRTFVMTADIFLADMFADHHAPKICRGGALLHCVIAQWRSDHNGTRGRHAAPNTLGRRLDILREQDHLFGLLEMGMVDSHTRRA